MTRKIREERSKTCLTISTLMQDGLHQMNLITKSTKTSTQTITAIRRNGRKENTMGKHDKQTNFNWNPMPDEFYKARIETLERENLSKDKEIEALENDIEMLKGCINELKADMGDLILENQSLRDAVVRAALREVE